MRTYAVFVRREGVAYIQAENEGKLMLQRRTWNLKTSRGTIIIRLKTCRRNEDDSSTVIQ